MCPSYYCCYDHPKTKWFKTKTFLYHGFCGSGIWTEQSRYDISLLCNVWGLICEDQESGCVVISRLDQVDWPQWLPRMVGTWFSCAATVGNHWSGVINQFLTPTFTCCPLVYFTIRLWSFMQILRTINFLKINVREPHKISLNIYLNKGTFWNFNRIFLC